MEEISRRVITGSLAVVDQNFVVFQDTISENIRMWDRSIENYEMIMACRDAGIHETIAARQGGYSDRILSGGSNFSGGELQRMEIARALAQEPTILILDEATSALDAEVEAEVIRRIRERGITCILIAHRLSTIRDCDEIVVLEEGKVVERGTHSELIGKNGAYSGLVRSD
jgi:ABC-type multidrug transport system fused ATPase/permease subunit